MNSEVHYVHQFGDFTLNASKRLLFKGQDVIPLNDRAFDVLMILIRNPGRVIPREEFFESVWRDVSVEPGNLDQSIFALRKALGDTSEPRRYIKTVPRRGFLFLENVTRTEEKSTMPGASATSVIIGQSKSETPSELLNEYGSGRALLGGVHP